MQQTFIPSSFFFFFQNLSRFVFSSLFFVLFTTQVDDQFLSKNYRVLSVLFISIISLLSNSALLKFKMVISFFFSFEKTFYIHRYSSMCICIPNAKVFPVSKRISYNFSLSCVCVCASVHFYSKLLIIGKIVIFHLIRYSTLLKLWF